MKKKEKQLAETALRLLHRSYDMHLQARREYYNAKFIQDPDIREKKLSATKEVYDYCMSTFSDPEVLRFREYFKENNRPEFEEILSRPLYKLI